MRSARAPVRLLYLQPAASFGGAERQAAQNLRLLPRFDVDVLPVIGPGREIVAFLEDAGVERFLFRPDLPFDPKAPRGGLARLGLYLRYVRAFFRMVRELEGEARRHRSEVVLASRPFAWVVAGFLGERLGIPVVWRAGTDFEHWLQPLALRGFAELRPPRAVVYTSTSVRASLSRAVPGGVGFVVHNGVDVERFAPGRAVPSLRRELGLGADEPVVALVARISPEKGIGLLVETCRRLRAALPAVRVLVAGDSGWRARLERELAGAGVADVVRLLGFVREVEQVYAAADVVISTSVSEGCPNALLEALAMGRAVVATRVGGTAEIIRDGVDGVLVPPGDPQLFTEAVVALLGSPSRRRTLGAAAAAYVAARFAVPRQVARLAGIVHWAAGRAPLRAEARRPPPMPSPTEIAGASPLLGADLGAVIPR